MEKILAPSILAADIMRLGEQIEAVKNAGAKYLHIDVMDGMFVPALSYGMCVVESIRKSCDMVLDVHLMIVEPGRHVEAFAKAGADIITIHLEACADAHEVIRQIHSCGCKAGVSIKPGTPIEVLEEYLDEVELILIMSVEPGFGGQKYIPESTERIRQTVPDWRDADVWFCGPAGFGQALKRDLTALGLPGARFHQELFEMR